jgi:hypothetical protein
MGSVGAGMRKEWLLFADPTACGCKPNKLDIIYDARAGNNQSPVLCVPVDYILLSISCLLPSLDTVSSTNNSVGRSNA